MELTFPLALSLTVVQDLRERKIANALRLCGPLPIVVLWRRGQLLPALRRAMDTALSWVILP
jgi:Flp pilus assembly protein protease CpaA